MKRLICLLVLTLVASGCASGLRIPNLMTRTVCFGDSMVDGDSNKNFWEYVREDKSESRFSYANEGKGGDTIAEGLKRFKSLVKYSIYPNATVLIYWQGGKDVMNLVKKYDVIYAEDLSVKNMTKNRKLAKSIMDCSWSEFIVMLQYKCDWYGKRLIKIDRFYPSSKTCSNCDYINEKLTLRDRIWECPSCERVHDRDVNAAINIYRQGLTITNVEKEALAGNVNNIKGETSTFRETLKKKVQSEPEAHKTLSFV